MCKLQAQEIDGEKIFVTLVNKCLVSEYERELINQCQDENA